MSCPIILTIPQHNLAIPQPRQLTPAQIQRTLNLLLTNVYLLSYCDKRIVVGLGVVDKGGVRALEELFETGREGEEGGGWHDDLFRGFYELLDDRGEGEDQFGEGLVRGLGGGLGQGLVEAVAELVVLWALVAEVHILEG